MFFQKLFLLSIIILLSVGAIAQEKIEPSTKLNKLYIDLSVGGMATGSGDIALNSHVTIGFQRNPLLGIGVGFAAATTYNDITHRSFNGLGVEYRLHHQQFILKYMMGLVLKHGYPSDSGEEFEYVKDNDLFHRLSVGYIPRSSFLNFGIVINATEGKFNRYFCETYPVEYCEDLGQVKSIIFNPQLFIGFNF